MNLNASGASASKSSFERVFIVFVVGLLTIGSGIPGLLLLAYPPLSSGYDMLAGSNVVAHVERRSVAARAGLRVGDVIRRPLPASMYDESDPPIYVLNVIGPGPPRAIVMRPEPRPISASGARRIVTSFLLYVLSFSVGATLLIVRPSAMTWGFFAYCVFQRLPLLTLHVPGGQPVFYAAWAAIILVMSPGLTGVLVFAARFPSGFARGWRRVAERISYVFIPLTIVAISWPILSETLGTAVILPWWIVVTIADVGLIALVADTILRADRARLQMLWIVVFPISLTLRIALSVGLDYNVPQFIFTSNLFDFIVPVFALYAVLRLHAFDIRFVASRAATLTVLSTCVVLFFLLADYFVSKNLAATKLAVTVDLAVAVALGFSLELIRRRVERVVELLVFRDRRSVETGLQRTVHALENTDTAEAVDGLLMSDIPEIMKLQSAALYRLEKPDFALRAVTPDCVARGDRIASSDPLVLHLKAERKASILSSRDWTVVVPIPVRGQLYGFAILGPRANGTRLDPDEIKLVERVFASAGFAYDHAQAEELLARIERQESELQRLRAKRQSKSIPT